MTEKEIYIVQNDLYWSIIKKFNSAQIPPLLQKIIMEGIYSRFQTIALQYDWDLNIQEYAKKQQENLPAQTIDFNIPNYLKEGDQLEEKIPDYIKNSNGAAKEENGEVSYK